MTTPNDLKNEVKSLKGELSESKANEGQLREALNEAGEKLAEMEAVLTMLTAAPNPWATVIRKVIVDVEGEEGGQRQPKPMALIHMDGKLLEVNLPPEEAEGVRSGTMLKLSIKTMQPIEIIKNPDPIGTVVMVRRAIDASYSEVEVENGSRLVYNGETSPQVGDRVILDPSQHVILKNLGKEDDRFTFTEETHITWNDIGGLKEAKESLIDAVELPFKHPVIYKKYGKKLPKGALLFGPPGCGKTLLGKATATAIARVHGKEISTGFNYVKGPEILSKWVGESEATIRQIFEKCRSHKNQHGYPAVVFIDEAEAILGRRGSGISSDVEKTIVPMFLSEMDGMEDSSAFILLATNRPDMLDPAVIREGRIDRKVKVGRPDAGMAKEIFLIHLAGKPLNNGDSHEDFAQAGAQELYSESRPLYVIERKAGEPVRLTLGHICSGAMIAAIVEEAVTIALKRDLQSGECGGVRKEDITAAVERIHGQHRDMNHKDEIEGFTSDWKADVKSVKRC